MNEQLQLIAIVEACGWEWKKGNHPSECWHHEDFYVDAPLFAEIRNKEDCLDELPRYLTDLGAIQNARSLTITTPALRAAYMNNLRQIVGRRCEINKAGIPLVSDYDCVDADAGEHAEALLRTLNRWITE